MFVSRNFIKLHPHQPDAEDDEVIGLLKGEPVGASNNAREDGECDEDEETRVWSQGIGQARSNILQGRVRARDSRGEFKTREAFHRAMLEARNFRGEALEKALPLEIERERASRHGPHQLPQPSGERDRDSIPVAFCSVIILARNINRSYPGGLRLFDRDYPDALRNRHLRSLAFMEWGDLQLAIDSLEAQGLVSSDFALGDMMLGEIAACPGIRFENAGDECMPRWFATAAFSREARL